MVLHKADKADAAAAELGQGRPGHKRSARH